MRFPACLLPLLLTATACANLDAQPTPEKDLLERAHRLLGSTPLIDGHNDLPWAMREGTWYDFDSVDIRTPQPQLMTDIPRLREGRVGGQFWSVYVPASLQGQAAVTATLEQVDAVYDMVRRYPDTFAFARTADDVERQFRAGKVASLMGMEGGHSIDSSMGTLRMFHELGVGYMTLTHSANVPWADAATDEPTHDGLSPFGELVVGEMNRLGMLVDLSHVSPATMADAIRVSRAPVIFSHSSARALCDVPRNVPDDILRRMPDNGGVVMVTFVPGFISQEVANYSRRAQAQVQLLRSQHGGKADAVDAAMAAWRTANPEPRATLSQVADHAEHVRAVAGVDHVGLGGDFDGISSVVQGLEDVSTYPALIVELLRRGWGDEDVQKLVGGNILRVMRRAEQVAAELQATESPSRERLR
jgi:membrane dipeptidase